MFQVQSPQGIIWMGDLTEGFLRYRFGVAYIWRPEPIHGGAYFRNFTVLIL